MTVYFDPPYPSVPPRCFVSPTAGMSIKPRHQHVDHNGMVYLPYLNTWSPYSSTLPELITIIASTFSADPPVYSTGPPQQQQQQQPQTIRPVNGPTATGGIGQPAASKVQPSGVVQNSSSAAGNDRRQSAYAAKLRLQEVEDRTTELIEKTREYNLARETAATAVKEAQVWLAGPKSTASTDSTNADEQESKLKSELGAQVLELVEEDCSLDEWLLGLDDALKSNSIDIEAYLREIRSTSRKQFEVRALRQKAVTQLQAAIIYKEEQEQRQRPSATTAGPSGPTINSYPAQSTGYVMAYPAPRWG
ncbi:hypothetical protein FOZ60_007273 [Perkinsus olseni]|uniref:Tumor susceptibility protein n=3 Tax=Perkinsus olseni TaxID=32597 RepID=A0A7J6NN00_PEROL|nr:hypothetical protein FOZ60_007273 [Perkinsus olseni]